MATVMKTPGVYIVEKSAFPNSVVEVATAVPAFIGYTEKADNKGLSLLNKPWRISSMAEFLSYYGGVNNGAPPTTFKIAPADSDKATAAAKTVTDAATAAEAAADAAVTAANAGSDAGTKSAAAAQKAAADAQKKVAQEVSDALTAAVTDAKSQPAPKTPPVASAIPHASKFSAGGVEFTVTQDKGSFLLYYSMLMFFQNGGGPCYIVSVGSYDDTIDKDKLTAGIDLLIKEQEPTMVVMPDAVLLAEADCVSTQQAALKHCGLDMKSRVAILDVWGGYRDRSDNTGNCIDNFRNALGINQLDYGAAYYPWLNTTIVGDGDLGYQNISNPGLLKAVLKMDSMSNPKADAIGKLIDAIGPTLPKEFTPDLLNKSLVASCPAFVGARAAMKTFLNTLPPAAAMAGIYTATDNTQGVWKAPANVSVNSVVSPTVNISSADQEDLNVTTQGKSINAIRAFVGEGTLVWGARTLDGNSLDWRYISVRRTMIMLEQSVQLATKAYVFENNVSTTWVTVKSMIRNFLTSVWKRGGLAGAVPDDAFAVFCGLGETMTPDDILEGIMRVTVLVAVTRPAEFIEITFQQQMQKS
jgi:uncharacterized protein